MKYLLSILACLILFSCNEDDPSDNTYVLPVFEFVEGLNDEVYVADGSTYNDEVILHITNSDQFPANSIIKINIAVDRENSSAVEGIDYNFQSGVYTFDSSNNFIQTIPIEIISNNSYTTYSKTITFIAGIENTGFGVSESFTINFTCFTDLTGNYLVTNTFCDEVDPRWVFETTIELSDDGRWYLNRADGFWFVCTRLDLQNPGYIEVDCDNVLYSNDLYLNFEEYDIGTILGGTWDQETGILQMRHTDTYFNGGPYYWTSTYTRQ